ncbi:MAG: hypothetical protein ACFB01_02775 [Cohaesibacteraceae bacterium]
MKALIVVLVALFGLVPAGVMLGLGFKRQFDDEVFGRIYVWDKPWVLVTQDSAVKQAYARLRRRMTLLLCVLFIMFVGILVLVP